MNTMQVEIVRLQPMRVATFTGFGVEPEHQAMQKMLDWAQPRGLLGDGAQRRVFGFNNPSPTAASPHYGYEFWLALGDDEAGALAADAEGKDMEIKSYPGGVYAVMRCKGVESITATWRDLVTWCEDSPYAFGGDQCLEEHIGNLDGPVDEWDFALYQAVVA